MRTRLYALVAATLLASAAGCAEEDIGSSAEETTVSQRGFGNPADHATRLQDKLGLSDDQTAELEAIFMDEGLSRGDRRAAVEAILTPEQAAAHKEMMSERRGKRGKGMRGKRGKFGKGMSDPASHAAMLKDKLDLSADQVAQVEATLADDTLERGARRAAIEAILTPEQAAIHQEMKSKRGKHGKFGKGMGDPASHAAMLKDKLDLSADQVAQVQAIFADDTLDGGARRAAIEAILTPEQAAAHKEMQSKRRGKRGMRGMRDLSK